MRYTFITTTPSDDISKSSQKNRNCNYCFGVGRKIGPYRKFSVDYFWAFGRFLGNFAELREFGVQIFFCDPVSPHLRTTTLSPSAEEKKHRGKKRGKKEEEIHIRRKKSQAAFKPDNPRALFLCWWLVVREVREGNTMQPRKSTLHRSAPPPLFFSFLFLSVSLAAQRGNTENENQS